MPPKPKPRATSQPGGARTRSQVPAQDSPSEPWTGAEPSPRGDPLGAPLGLERVESPALQNLDSVHDVEAQLHDIPREDFPREAGFTSHPQGRVVSPKPIPIEGPEQARPSSRKQRRSQLATRILERQRAFATEFLDMKAKLLNGVNELEAFVRDTTKDIANDLERIQEDASQSSRSSSPAQERFDATRDSRVRREGELDPVIEAAYVAVDRQRLPGEDEGARQIRESLSAALFPRRGPSQEERLARAFPARPLDSISNARRPPPIRTDFREEEDEDEDVDEYEDQSTHHTRQSLGNTPRGVTLEEPPGPRNSEHLQPTATFFRWGTSVTNQANANRPVQVVGTTQAARRPLGTLAAVQPQNPATGPAYVDTEPNIARIRAMIRDAVSLPSTTAPPAYLKFTKPKPPAPYDGADDIGNLENWLQKLLEYMETLCITGPDLDRDRLRMLGENLGKQAYAWYSQHIKSPNRMIRDWTFEEAVVCLHRRFIKDNIEQLALQRYESLTYEPSQGGAADLIDRMNEFADRMVERPTEYEMRN